MLLHFAFVSKDDSGTQNLALPDSTFPKANPRRSYGFSVQISLEKLSRQSSKKAAKTLKVLRKLPVYCIIVDLANGIYLPFSSPYLLLTPTSPYDYANLFNEV